MLETIREFGLEQLGERGNMEELRGRHAELFLELAESRGEAQENWETWLDLADTEHDNLRSAIALARESGEVRLELRLVTALGPFWEARGYLVEGKARTIEALADDPDAPTRLQNQALSHGVLLAFKRATLGRLASGRRGKPPLPRNPGTKRPFRAR